MTFPLDQVRSVSIPSRASVAATTPSAAWPAAAPLPRDRDGDRLHLPPARHRGGTLTDVHLSDQGLRTNRRKSSRDNIVAWGPRLRAAVTEDERFSLHDLKRKGITDYKGTRAEKQEGSGHRSPGG